MIPACVHAAACAQPKIPFALQTDDEDDGDGDDDDEEDDDDDDDDNDDDPDSSIQLVESARNKQWAVDNACTWNGMRGRVQPSISTPSQQESLPGAAT